MPACFRFYSLIRFLTMAEPRVCSKRRRRQCLIIMVVMKHVSMCHSWQMPCKLHDKNKAETKLSDSQLRALNSIFKWFNRYVIGTHRNAHVTFARERYVNSDPLICHLSGTKQKQSVLNSHCNHNGRLIAWNIAAFWDFQISWNFTLAQESKK